MTEHSLLPWRYRPLEHDDWGMIRGLDGSVVAVARYGSNSTESDLQRHRRNKTDPCGANGQFIVKAVNGHDALVKALQLQEAAEEAHANCGECNGEDVPELCPVCFPLFDDARIARRGILSVVGGSR
jgi:hypothetical protein